jgi:hypothetical protein
LIFRIEHAGETRLVTARARRKRSCGHYERVTLGREVGPAFRIPDPYSETFQQLEALFEQSFAYPEPCCRCARGGGH